MKRSLLCVLDIALPTSTETVTPFAGRASSSAVGCPQPAWISRPPSSTGTRRAPGRWLFLLLRTQAQMVGDARDGQLVGDSRECIW